MTSPRRTTNVFAMPQLNSSAELFATLPHYSLNPQDGERTVSEIDGPQRRPTQQLAAPSRAEPAAGRHSFFEELSYASSSSSSLTERRPLPRPPAVLQLPAESPREQSKQKADAPRATMPVPVPTPDKASKGAEPTAAPDAHSITRPLSVALLTQNVEKYKVRSNTEANALSTTPEQVAYLRMAIDACQSRYMMSGFIRDEAPAGFDALLGELSSYIKRSGCHEAKLAIPGLLGTEDIFKIVSWKLSESIHDEYGITQLTAGKARRRSRYEMMDRLFNAIVRSAIVSDHFAIRKGVAQAFGQYLEKIVARAEAGEERRLQHHIRRLDPQWVAFLLQHLADAAEGPEADRNATRRLWLKDFRDVRLKDSNATTLHKAFAVLVNLHERQTTNVAESKARGWTAADGAIVVPLLSLLATLLDYSN